MTDAKTSPCGRARHERRMSSDPRVFFFFSHQEMTGKLKSNSCLTSFFFLQLDQRSRVSCTIVNSVIQKNLYRDNSNCFSLLGVYCVDRSDSDSYPLVLKMEHCALQRFGNQWQLEVKCRPKGSKASSGRWINIKNIYPDATVQVKQNYIELTLPTVEESHEFAVFGTPEVKDKKRMRLGIFGGKATRGQDWNIVGTLLDDTMMAFETLCEKEERKGRQLLTILPGLFISNSGEDIKIDISGLEKGWKIIGSSLMTIKSEDAWNSPENSTDFPCCVFEITHVDEAKQLFSCEITASHLNDSAETELVAFFEQANEVMTPPELPIQENNIFDLFVFLQMLVFFVECFTGSSFDPQAPKKGSVADKLESFHGK